MNRIKRIILVLAGCLVLGLATMGCEREYNRHWRDGDEWQGWNYGPGWGEGRDYHEWEHEHGRHEWAEHHEEHEHGERHER